MPEEFTVDEPCFGAIRMSREAARLHLSRIGLDEERGRADRRIAGLEAALAVLRSDPGRPVPLGWRPGRDAADARRLARSGLFLDRWYAARQGTRPGRAAFRRFLTTGVALDHAPNPFFDPVWYRAAHLGGRTDEAPILHYLRIGAPGALAPGPLFDPIAYAAHNPDIAQEPDLLAHLLRRGLREGRRFLPTDGAARPG